MAQYFKNIWLSFYTILVGMKVTIVHLFKINVTVQYPDVHPREQAGTANMPPNARNRLYVGIDDCSGCRACQRACPVNCIEIETVKCTAGDPDVTPLKSGGKRGLWVTKFTIDFAKCCFCGLCVPPCPTGTIIMTDEFEYCEFDKDDFLYTFSTMTPEMIKEKTDMNQKAQAEKKKKAAEKKAAEAKAKAAEEDNKENIESK